MGMNNITTEQRYPRPDNPLVSIISPVLNEQTGVGHFLDTLAGVLRTYDHEIIVVDDGSTDGTLERLLAIRRRMPGLKVIELSRNFGKEAALVAGFDACRGDIVITMDADLQHPPHVIEKMVSKWREGYDIVSAVRAERDSDAALKKLSSGLFYRIFNLLSRVKIINGEGDFRLFDRIAVEALKTLTERTRFNKGLFNWIGFKTGYVAHPLPERHSGMTKWNYWKLFRFALDGIISFSNVPLKLFTWAGFLTAFSAFAYAGYIALRTLFLGVDVPGYASIVTAVFFMGGATLFGIGVLGEYISRIFVEAKSRPLYIARKIYD